MSTTYKRIGVIGSGIVGQVLDTAFLAEEYKVMLGSRDALKEELTKWKTNNDKGSLGTFAEVAAFANIIVLATKGTVTLNGVVLAGKENFNSKW